MHKCKQYCANPSESARTQAKLCIFNSHYKSPLHFLGGIEGGWVCCCQKVFNNKHVFTLIHMVAILIHIQQLLWMACTLAQYETCGLGAPSWFGYLTLIKLFTHHRLWHHILFWLTLTCKKYKNEIVFNSVKWFQIIFHLMWTNVHKDSERKKRIFFSN